MPLSYKVSHLRSDELKHPNDASETNQIFIMINLVFNTTYAK